MPATVARFTPISLGADGKTERAWAELVSANYFDVLRVKPVIGRTFLPEESGDQPGAYPVAVISHKMWRNRFLGDPKVLGKTIRLNRHELTIVGVAPPEFRGSMVGLVYDVWMPITMAKAMAADHAAQNIRVNTLSPGGVETDRMLRFGSMEKAREVLGSKHLMKRLGLPQEIAQAALFLASDASSFMTGADLRVDGGYNAV